jgi:predicted alpha/beta hydrolase family esterase
MKSAIILHGYQNKQEFHDPSMPAPGNGHWMPWLQKQLMIKDIVVWTPTVPHSWKLNYKDWAEEFERYPIGDETMLVGHSCGGGFIVRWLSENPQVKVDKVVLVAPWVNPLKDEDTDFFDFEINPDIVKQTNGITIFASDNDFESVQKSVEIIKNSVYGVVIKEFHDYGHFCLDDMGTVEFPELRDHLLV